MNAIRRQFFLSFAILGSVLPYISVFFRDRGLDPTQIGYAFAIGSVALLLSPVIVTLLADTKLDPRWLLAGLLLACGISSSAMPLVVGLVPLIAMYAVHSLAVTPLLPLQDGVLFAELAARGRRGETPIAYHRVRVWGTVGFIVPSLGIYWLLRGGMAVEVTLYVAAAFALLAAANATLGLPDTRGERTEPGAGSRLPTVAALRTLGRGHVLVFCVANFLVAIAAAAYYAFYPVYLTEIVGIDRQWLGLISALGVGLEILFMLAAGWQMRVFGLRGVLLMGMAAMGLRFVLLAAWPNAGVAIATQALHGLTVVLASVAVPTFLNAQADERFRHSIQGVFTVVVFGAGRTLGNVLAGYFAEWSLFALFWSAAATCAVAMAVIVVGFRPPAAATPPRAGVRDEASPAEESAMVTP
jgi:PPP family 3-phenylpropionic acid transporter